MIFTKKIAAMVVLFGMAISATGALGQQTAKKTRAFRMGFTPFVSDFTAEAHTEMVQFFKDNADIVAQHMESVPWTEALNGRPFQANLMKAWQDRKNLTPAGAKVYVALSPGRGELADYWGASEHDPLPAEFKGKTFSDASVKQAYLTYCKQAVEFFKPNYLAIGIEVNELAFNAPAKVAAYVELHQYVYQELKKDYPKLPIFASFTLHSLLDSRRTPADRERALAFVKGLMPYNDLVGISFYPFFGNLSDQVDTAFTFLTTQFDVFHKPYAFVETGEAADKLTVQLDGKPWVIDGTPARQLAYYQKLFSLAQTRQMEFIVTFLYKDYDSLWKKIADKSPSVFQAWQDTGLLDEKGTSRPAYQLWKQFYDMPAGK
jgi:hypothetical protein